VGTWRSYLAIGDSFTEGMSDLRPDGSYRGWADRIAEMLAARTPDFRYANVAVRGKLLGSIVAEQVPIAESHRPELITFCGGGNDVLRPGVNVVALAELASDALGRLVATGADVVVFTGFDPYGLPLRRRLHRLIGTFNELLRDAANEHGCRIVDLWSMKIMHNRHAWSRDRLHMSSAGHHRVALHTAEVLGLPTTEDWRAPWPPSEVPAWTQQRREDLAWVREYLAPWVRRLVTRHVGGSGSHPKRAELLPFTHQDC
jgi:lysophospholipase L1-like esterase